MYRKIQHKRLKVLHVIIYAKGYTYVHIWSTSQTQINLGRYAVDNTEKMLHMNANYFFHIACYFLCSFTDHSKMCLRESKLLATN
jgi:pantothenate kinase-related protein Tda10